MAASDRRSKRLSWPRAQYLLRSSLGSRRLPYRTCSCHVRVSDAAWLRLGRRAPLRGATRVWLPCGWCSGRGQAQPQPRRPCLIHHRSQRPTRRRVRRNHCGQPSLCRRGRRNRHRHLPLQRTHSASLPLLLAPWVAVKAGAPLGGYERLGCGPYIDAHCPRQALHGERVLRPAPARQARTPALTPPKLARSSPVSARGLSVARSCRTLGPTFAGSRGARHHGPPPPQAIRGSQKRALIGRYATLAPPRAAHQGQVGSVPQVLVLVLLLSPGLGELSPAGQVTHPPQGYPQRTSRRGKALQGGPSWSAWFGNRATRRETRPLRPRTAASPRSSCAR